MAGRVTIDHQQLDYFKKPTYDSNFNIIQSNFQPNYSNINQKLGLKNLQFEESLIKQEDNNQKSFQQQNNQYQNGIQELIKKEKDNFFEEQFDESEESRINFNEKDNDVNIVIRQSKQPNFNSINEKIQDKQPIQQILQIQQNQPSILQQQMPPQQYQPIQQHQQTIILQQTQQQINFTTSTIQKKVKTKKYKKVQINKINLDEEKSRAIQIIELDEKGKFKLNQELLDLLKKYNEYKIGFACIAGQYRTGKSFILNQLLDIKGRGFNVESSTQACTQGLWMWSEPVLEQNTNTVIFFMDSEGSNSLEKNKNHDAKIFALSILMSTVFVFNTVGCINETSIAQLQLTTTLSKNILTSQQNSLNNYTPKFIWLLRDFVLEMKDQTGQILDPNTYMEQCLVDESSYHNSSDQNKQIRECLLSFFSDRECVTMVRPVIDESDLKQLNSLPTHRLRKEFIKQVEGLKEIIVQKCEAKQLNNVFLNAEMFYSMCQSYVELINDGGVPNIDTAWDYIQQQQCQEVYDQALYNYQQMLAQQINLDQTYSESQLFQLLNSIRNSILNYYQQSLLDQVKSKYYSRYFHELNQFIHQSETKTVSINDQTSAKVCEELINKITKEFKNKLNKNQYQAENLDIFYEDFNEIMKIYTKQSQGSKNLQILTQFLQKLTPFTYKQILQTVKVNNSTNDIEINGLKKEIQDQQKQNDFLKKQSSSFQSQIQQLEQQLSQIPASSNNEDITKLKKQITSLNQLKVQNEEIVLQLKQDLSLKDRVIIEKDKEIEKMKKNQSACCIIY